MKDYKFSAVFQPTALFSLKDSNSTNSGAKTLFLPSPYAVKMAIINQAITMAGVDFSKDGKKNKAFGRVRDVEIEYFIKGNYCINNCFLKILKPSRSSPGEVQKTVSFREYVHINEAIEFVFTVKDKEAIHFLKKFIHKINYFGKRGCFFQFTAYKDTPQQANVTSFAGNYLNPGILQEYDDFGEKFSFDDVNSYGGKGSAKREKKIRILPFERVSSSKSFSHFRTIEP